MSTAAIAQGLAAAISASGLRALDYLPSSPPAPCAVVGVEQIDYERAFAGGAAPHRMVVTVLVRQTSDRAAMSALYAHMAPAGPPSVKAAIEADTSLGGACQTLVVTDARNLRQIQIGEASYLAIDFAVRVHP